MTSEVLTDTSIDIHHHLLQNGAEVAVLLLISGIPKSQNTVGAAEVHIGQIGHQTTLLKCNLDIAIEIALCPHDDRLTLRKYDNGNGITLHRWTAELPRLRNHHRVEGAPDPQPPDRGLRR